jgi:hypothetical protein
LIVSTAASIVISTVRPSALNDQNAFLRNFINHELINILGVILAITLASVANIHLAFNRIEERYNAPDALSKSRGNLKKAAYWLIGLFVAGIVIVVSKPMASDPSTPTLEALFNSAGLLVLLWQVLILVSLMQLVFMIKPEFPP